MKRSNTTSSSFSKKQKPTPYDYSQHLIDFIEGRTQGNLGILSKRDHNDSYHTPQNSQDALAHAARVLQETFPGDFSMLSTPEHFFGEGKEISNNKILEGPGHTNDTFFANLPYAEKDLNFQDLQSLSENNPNILFNPAYFYHKPFLAPEDDPEFEGEIPDDIKEKIENFRNLSADTGYKNLAHNSGDTFIFDESMRPDRELVWDEGEAKPLSYVKNKSLFYMGGDKIGSSKKRGFFNEMTEPVQALGVRVFDTRPKNDRYIKTYGNEEDLTQKQSRASQALSNNFYNPLCMDYACDSSQPLGFPIGDKRGMFLQANSVNPGMNATDSLYPNQLPLFVNANQGFLTTNPPQPFFSRGQQLPSTANFLHKDHQQHPLGQHSDSVNYPENEYPYQLFLHGGFSMPQPQGAPPAVQQNQPPANTTFTSYAPPTNLNPPPAYPSSSSSGSQSQQFDPQAWKRPY